MDVAATRSTCMNSPPPASAHGPTRRFQFGIWHIFIVTTIVAVLLWFVPWFEGSPWAAVWFSVLAGSAFAGLGFYVSALMLRIVFHSVREVFGRRQTSRVHRLGVLLLNFAALLLMSLMAFGIPYNTLVDYGDAMGGAARWLILAGGVIGAIAFAATQLTSDAPPQ